MALASQPISLYLLPVAVDTLYPGASRQVWVTETEGAPGETGAADWPLSREQRQGEWGQVGRWHSETGTGQGLVRWVRQGPPAAGLSGWPSPRPPHRHCLGGDSPGGSLEKGMTGAGEDE